MTDKADIGKGIEEYLSTLTRVLAELDRDELKSLAEELLAARERDAQVFTMGNGGSAATASHFACDFNKGLGCGRDRRFRLICLNDNILTLTAYANDVGYDSVFVEPLRNFLRPGDLVIGISGSGNSANVVKAFEYANANGGLTFALVGYDGGMLKRIAEKCIHVRINDMQIIEDSHMVLDHLLLRILTSLA